MEVDISFDVTVGAGDGAPALVCKDRILGPEERDGEPKPGSVLQSDGDVMRGRCSDFGPAAARCLTRCGGDPLKYSEEFSAASQKDFSGSAIFDNDVIVSACRNDSSQEELQYIFTHAFKGFSE